MFNRIKAFINPEQNPDLVLAPNLPPHLLPTLWLLGKTGAGKSSLIQALTGLDAIEVGNGFAPCTKTLFKWDFPQEKPILRFLDTRGLGEAHYDPTDDLVFISTQSHVLLVVAKIDDPEQSAVVDALEQIRKQKHIKHIVLVHTAVKSCAEADKVRMKAFHQALFDKAWGEAIPSIEVDFDCDKKDYFNRDGLVNELTDMLPIVDLILTEQQHASAEDKNFNNVLSNEVLWYAGAAAISDALPAVGVVSVPAVQAKMLHSLANQYGIDWNLQTFTELTGALGAGVLVRYGISFGIRELIKFVPGYGQIAGAAAAATFSFAATYALGRATCYYFYQKNKGKPIDRALMQQLFKDAFIVGKKASDNE